MIETNAIQFSLRAISARAAQLSSLAQWQAWAQAPWLPSGMPECKLERVPALQRRRVERSGRLALEVAFELLDTLTSEQHAQIALVFCSRHGDVQRSAGIMRELAKLEPVSPTQFGLSVHNAVAAQFSIAAGLTNTYSVIAAGKTSVEAAMIEAGSLLTEHPLVLLVVYDEPLPDDFRRFEDEAIAPHAWGMVLGPADEDPALCVSWNATQQDATARTQSPDLPASLAALQFVLSAQTRWIHNADGTEWHWQRR